MVLNNNIKSRITDDSWIDLSNTRHFSLLPNLSYFVGASFLLAAGGLFTNHAAAGGKPSETQVATLLNLAARSGNATGTALANNRVVLGIPSGGAGLQYLHDRDVLAVSALDQKTFNQRLLEDSPYYQTDNQLGVRESGLSSKVQRWLAGDWTSASPMPIAISPPAAPGAALLATVHRGTHGGRWWWRWPATMIS